MPTPTIPNGEEHFFNILYEGNGAGQRVGKFVPFTDNGTIANSCIFNDDDLPRLYRQISAGNRKTYTISLWFKLGKSPSTDSAGFWSTSPSNDSGYGGNPSPYNMQFLQFASGAIEIQDYNVSGNHYIMRKRTNRTFEDTSKWYHFLMAVDTTQSTESDRMKMYIDGDLITSFNDINSSYGYPDQDEDTSANQNTYYDVINIGYNQHWDGYIAEFNFVDGSALTPDTFGLTDTSTGRWIPKTLSGITYGTNGYRLQFGSSSALGDDTSGNENDFTSTNLATTDQTTDSPTQNHATIDINTASNSSMTFAEGNLKVEMNNVYPGNVLGTLGASSGKYYWEVTLGGTGSSANGYSTGVAEAEWSKLNSDPDSVTSPFSSIVDSRGYYFHNGTYISSSTTFTSGDVISIALNLDDSEISYYKNNTIIGSAQPLVEGRTYFPFFSNQTTVADKHYTPNFGQKSWNYTPPTGFVALQQDNLPTTDKGIVGLTWIKDRDNAYSHGLRDSSRGRHKDIFSNLVQDEVTNTDGVQKFLKGGIQIEDLLGLNASGASIVAWNWVANSGSTSSNADGSITSTVQANTTAGFSIVQWTGLGGGTGRTIGHGLSSAPEWIVVKNLTGSSSYNWNVYHIGLDASNPSDYFISLNTTNARDNSVSTWNDTAPTSTVFSVNHEATAGALGNKMIAYCWHGVDGFSKFGKYTGNGVSDGPFVYTGFKPAWLLVKANNAANWYLCDAARSPMNPLTTFLHTDRSDADYSNFGRGFDFLSNGFKVRQESGYGANYSGVDTYFIAFAEHPFIGDGTSPVTAR